MKTNIFVIVMRELITNNKMSTNDIFKKSRKNNQMRLTDFENFIKELCKVDIYFEDIEECWKFWG